MTDIEHAKKYAEESISLATSMYNPKAEVIAETACLYGLTFKNKQITDLEDKLANADYLLEGRDNEIADLEKKNKVLAQNLEDTEIINNTLEKENADLQKSYEELYNSMRIIKDQLTKAKDLLEQWVELYKPKLEGYPITPIQEQTEQFLNSEVEK